MKQVIILRGIPGSGKTTFAKKYHPNALVISTDDYFVNKETGEYKFDPRQKSAAHEDAMRRFQEAIVSDVAEIVVDNSNVRLWECKQYYDYAQEHGYQARAVYVHADPEAAAERNIHNVNKEWVLKRYEQLEHDPTMEEWIYWDGELLPGNKEWVDQGRSQELRRK